MDACLEVKLHSDKAHLPTRGSPNATGYNLYSAEDKVIPAQGKVLVDTQISIATPPGTYGRIAPRSGLATKHMIATGAGVIDSDKDFEIKRGDRIAQLLLERNATPQVKEVHELGTMDRGNQGFGSTGGFTPSKNTTEKQEKDVLIAKVGETDKGDEIWIANTEELVAKDDVWINTKTSNSIEFYLLHDKKEDVFLLTKQIPKEYHEFIDVFDKKKADRFPDSRIWDHKIELKEGFQPRSFKMYNLTPEEQKELDVFLKDNLKKGYIRPS